MRMTVRGLMSKGLARSARVASLCRAQCVRQRLRERTSATRWGANGRVKAQ